VNRERGDDLRADLYGKTRRVLDHMGGLGIATPNRYGSPIIEIPLADADEIDDVGDYLFDSGIYVTMATYPLVPRNEVGFRAQVTSANPDSHIQLLCDTLTELAGRFALAPGLSSAA
jgi:7-keto-8-aminopelargonate synthetase-like enzyme